MKQKLTHFDIYDIFTFPEDRDLCRFNKFYHTKEEFLAGDFSVITPCWTRNVCSIFFMPTNNEITMDELVLLFEILEQETHLEGLFWGCSSDDKITHYEVFLMKIH